MTEDQIKQIQAIVNKGIELSMASLTPESDIVILNSTVRTIRAALSSQDVSESWERAKLYFHHRNGSIADKHLSDIIDAHKSGANLLGVKHFIRDLQFIADGKKIED